MHFFGHGYCKYLLKDKFCLKFLLSFPRVFSFAISCCGGDKGWPNRSRSAGSLEGWDSAHMPSIAFSFSGLHTMGTRHSMSQHVTATLRAGVGQTWRPMAYDAYSVAYSLSRDHGSCVGPVGQQTKDRLDPAWQSARFRRLNHVCLWYVYQCRYVYLCL